MIPEREREALMRLTMCARRECRICMYQKRCDFDFRCELATKNMNILADALRAEQTEPNSSEKPNNCEHITEDGVTCAKYPACDDCLDNPLNKLKGSERLVKGNDEPTISKMEQVDKDINVRSKTEPQTDCTEALTLLWIKNMVTDEEFYRIDARLKVMPQTERSE